MIYFWNNDVFLKENSNVFLKEKFWYFLNEKEVMYFFNPLSARIFTDFELWLLEGRVLHNGAWVATLLGTLLGSRNIKRSNFQNGISRPWQLRGWRKYLVSLKEVWWNISQNVNHNFSKKILLFCRGK